MAREMNRGGGSRADRLIERLSTTGHLGALVFGAFVTFGFVLQFCGCFPQPPFSFDVGRAASG